MWDGDESGADLDDLASKYFQCLLDERVILEFVTAWRTGQFRRAAGGRGRRCGRRTRIRAGRSTMKSNQPRSRLAAPVQEGRTREPAPLLPEPPLAPRRWPARSRKACSPPEIVEAASGACRCSRRRGPEWRE